ncbi:MAG TPA: helix-turn-helix transcriptional regulator [Candidatus Limnocylindria bacterium]|jgi:transcriptional regulator with XRE-family HTH domain
MGSRDDRRTIGRLKGERLARQLTAEWRELRLGAGVSQSAVSQTVGISRSAYARLERGEATEIGVVRAAIVTAALGGDLSVKVYPGGPPIRDAGHVALLAMLDARVSGRWRVTHEAPVQAGDGRAWDRRLDGPVSIGLEAEVALRDLQALERRMQRKKEDSGVTRMILLVRGTRRNREVLRELLPSVRGTFPLGSRELLRALADGRDPGADGLLVLDAPFARAT